MGEAGNHIFFQFIVGFSERRGQNRDNKVVSRGDFFDFLLNYFSDLAFYSISDRGKFGNFCPNHNSKAGDGPFIF